MKENEQKKATLEKAWLILSGRLRSFPLRKITEFLQSLLQKHYALTKCTSFYCTRCIFLPLKGSLWHRNYIISILKAWTEMWIITKCCKEEGEKDSDNNHPDPHPHFKGFLLPNWFWTLRNICIRNSHHFWCASNIHHQNMKFHLIKHWTTTNTTEIRFTWHLHTKMRGMHVSSVREGRCRLQETILFFSYFSFIGHSGCDPMHCYLSGHA